MELGIAWVTDGIEHSDGVLRCFLHVSALALALGSRSDLSLTHCSESGSGLSLISHGVDTASSGVELLF